jgi:hypothetical protein
VGKPRQISSQKSSLEVIYSLILFGNHRQVAIKKILIERKKENENAHQKWTQSPKFFQ